MSSPETPQVDLDGKNAKELHNSGGKCYATQDYASAVLYLSRASELGVKEYGDPVHDNMGEIYLMYGKSLLEFTREGGDPLGEDVPKEVPVGEEEAEGEAKEGDEAEADEGDEDGDDNEGDEEGGDGAESDEEEKEGDGDKSVEDENAKNEEEEKKGEVEGSASGVEFNGEKGGDKVDDDVENKEGENNTLDALEKEEPSDLQVAWEILELAKHIFAKRGDSGKSYLADTLITLGEISMENDNTEPAIADIKEAIEILKTIHEENSRVLAEAYYKLGMAIAMDNKIEEAVQQYNKSKEILENRVKSLETSEKAIHKREVEDMKKVIPEIDEKVADLKSFQEEQVKQAAENPRPILPGSPEKKATDISHLVKRKRKPEDEESAGPSNPPPKKPSLD